MNIDVAPAFIDEVEMVRFKGGEVIFETWDWPNFEEQSSRNKFFFKPQPDFVPPPPPRINAQVLRAVKKLREAKDGTRFLVIGNIDESFEPYLLERVRSELDVEIV